MNLLDDLFISMSMEDTENGFTTCLWCNPSHPIYKAHFPGNPITPGACLLQTAGEILQRKLERPLYLKASKNVKFLNVLVPSEGKTVQYNFSRPVENESGCKTQVVIADDATVYAKMSLTFSYEQL